MNQPTAPCSAAEHEQRRRAASHSRLGICRRTANQHDADEEDQADDPAEQPVDPLPEEDELEPGEGHPGGAGTCRYCGVCW